MNNLRRDALYAWRNMLRQPATSLLIIITLALGIGVNTAMFSMTWHVLLAPLPYEDGDRLVKLEQRESANTLDDIPWSLPTLIDLREQNQVFSSVLQYFQTEYTLYSDQGSFLVYSAAVDGNFFATLGVAPVLGRNFTPADDRSEADPVMMLGNRFWMETFDGDPAVIGSTVEVYGTAYTVIGVLPDIPPYPRTNDIWMPAGKDPAMSHPMFVNQRSSSGLVSHVIGKLAEGISLDQARQDLNLVVDRLKNSYPDIYRGESGYAISLQPLKDVITGSSMRTISLLMVLAILVVFIASINFANIKLADMMRRSQELAIREAVGASPGRIRRQLITENIVISAIGGLIGLVLAGAALRFITDFAAVYTPLASVIHMDVRVLWFCLALTIVTALSSALIASLQTRNINQTLKEGTDKATSSTQANWLRNILLAVQCALAFVMLTSTALMASSLNGLAGQAIGYDTEGVFVLNTIMRGTDPSTIWAERDLILQVLHETRALPGVMAAGLSGLPLLDGPGFPPNPMLIEGSSNGGTARSIREPFTIVSEGFFDAMNIALLAGRSFTASDDEKAPKVIMVNDAFASRYFPGASAVGQRLSWNGGKSWETIIGVVSDIRARGIDTPDTPMIYTHYGASPTQIINLYVKTIGDQNAMANAVTGIMQRLDPLQPIDAITSLDEVKARWMAPARLRAGLIAAFGLLALVVTLSGVIGVVSYNIGQRVREIGVHMAIGATPTRISRLFVLQGMKTCLFGLALGIVLMLAAAPTLEPLLYGTTATNAAIYLASATVLIVAILIALYLPASKASRMSPVVALHAE